MSIQPSQGISGGVGTAFPAKPLPPFPAKPLPPFPAKPLPPLPPMIYYHLSGVLVSDAQKYLTQVDNSQYGNKDGSITADEIAKYLQNTTPSKLEIHHGSVQRTFLQDLERGLRKPQSNDPLLKDGKLEFGRQSTPNSLSPKKPTELERLAQRDGNGKNVTRKDIFPVLNGSFTSVPKEEVRNAIKVADKNGDGALTAGEAFARAKQLQFTNNNMANVFYALGKKLQQGPPKTPPPTGDIPKPAVTPLVGLLAGLDQKPAVAGGFAPVPIPQDKLFMDGKLTYRATDLNNELDQLVVRPGFGSSPKTLDPGDLYAPGLFPFPLPLPFPKLPEKPIVM